MCVFDCGCAVIVDQVVQGEGFGLVSSFVVAVLYLLVLPEKVAHNFLVLCGGGGKRF